MGSRIVVLRNGWKSKTKMYFVTTITSKEFDYTKAGHEGTNKKGNPLPGIEQTRCPGYFIKRKDAFSCIEENWGDIYEGDFTYAIVERIGDGIYDFGPQIRWYKWKGSWDHGRYVQIDQPEHYKQIVGIAVG